MPASTIKIYTAIPANATSDSIVSIDIPEDGELFAISGHILIDGQADNVATGVTRRVKAELSFLSTNQFTSNDARGSIWEIAVGYFAEDSLGGAAAKVSEQAHMMFHKGIPLQAGERLHLHGDSNQASLTSRVTMILYLDFKGGSRRHPRRR